MLGESAPKSPGSKEVLGEKISGRTETLTNASGKENWKTLSFVAKELGVHYEFAKKILDEIARAHPEQIEVRTPKRRPDLSIPHYSPEFVAEARKRIQEISPPDGWKTTSSLAKDFGVDFYTVKKVLDEAAADRPQDIFSSIERTKQGGSVLYYSPQLVEEVSAKLNRIDPPPQGWRTIRDVAGEIGLHTESLRHKIDNLVERSPKLGEFVKQFTAKRLTTLTYISPELIQKIHNTTEVYRTAEEGYETLRAVSKKLDIAPTTTQSLLKEYEQQHPESFQKGRTDRGQTATFISPEAVAFLQQHIDKNNRVRESWSSGIDLANRLGTNSMTVYKHAKKIAGSYAEKQIRLVDTGGRGNGQYYYSPELTDKIELEFTKYPEAQGGWMTNNAIAKELGVDFGTTQRIANQLIESHPEWATFARQTRGTKWPTTHFAPELIAKLRESIASHDILPHTWVSRSVFSKEMDIVPTFLSKIAETAADGHPDWIRFAKKQKGKAAVHYAPELQDAIRKILAESRHQAPEGWITVSSLASSLSAPMRVTELIKEHREKYPDECKEFVGKNGHLSQFVSPRFAEMIREKSNKKIEVKDPPPPGWIPVRSVGEHLGYSRRTVEIVASKYIESNPEWVREYRSIDTDHVNFFYSPELIELIKTDLENPIPKDWRNMKEIAKEFEASSTVIKGVLEHFPTEELEKESVKGKRYGGPMAHYYSPKVVEFIEQRIFPAPKLGWKSLTTIASELDVSRSGLEKRIEVVQKQYPEEFEIARSTSDSRTTYYSPVFVDALVQTLPVEVPKGWRNAFQIAQELGITNTTAQRQVERFREIYPESFMVGREKGKSLLVTTYYGPDVIQAVRESQSNPPPEGWISAFSLQEQFDIRNPQLIDIRNELLGFEEEEGMFKGKMGRPIVYYGPHLVAAIKERLPKKPPSSWRNLADITEELNIERTTFENRAREIGGDNLNSLRGEFKEKNKISALYYSPELIALVKDSLPPIIPENWKTLNQIAREFGWGQTYVRNNIDAISANYPEDYGEFRPSTSTLDKRWGTYYSPLVISMLKERLFQNAPPGWKTATRIAIEAEINPKLLKAVAESMEAEFEEGVGEFRGSGGQGSHTVSSKYYSPEVAKRIVELVLEHKTGKEQIKLALKREENLRNECEGFVDAAVEDKTLEAQKFKKLASLFPGHSVDILCKFRPDFKGISQDYIKGTLAKYLGDILVERTHFRVEDAELTLPYLSDGTFQDSLFEVIKESCLSEYHERKLGDSSLGDGEILTSYFKSIRGQTSSLNDQELENVVSRVETYYRSILEDFHKPVNIVGSLREGRQFPDLNQVLNVKEIKDKKKMLIGDEMGMGKSASAILSKEYLGLRQALVVVPSNVINTWQEYLSDKVGDDGKQIGYFNPGQSPRVLTIEDTRSLETVDSSAYDYVLISQERMTEEYVEALKKFDYDMLIVDEVHKVKNIAEGVRSQNVIELSKKIEGNDRHLVLLSGTPVPNKVRDVSMILKLLYPEKFGDVEDKELVKSIINGDIIGLRNLLVPRMQMKSLLESIEMPELKEETLLTELSPEEKGIYEVLLDDDELTASQKIIAFRKFVMNPDSLEVTPGIKGSKIEDTKNLLSRVFQEKSKVVLFVNSYIEGIIRGENNILDKFNLPPDVTIRTIEGQISKDERQEIERELRESDKKILLAVSGQTADVGVDFSAAEEVVVYNNPWTEYDRKQQIARVYRPGHENDLKVTTSVARGTIEEGIQEYTKLKYNAIQKLLRGVPVTEIEKGILKQSEKQEMPDVEGDPIIAKEWLNSPQNRLHKFFGITKGIGEKNFHKFLLEHGEEYAESYSDMGSRGFQANTGRVVATLIDRFITERREQPGDTKILDIASGPEMLKTHIGNQYKDQVFSLDINPSHFAAEGENRIVGSFVNLPIKEKSIDYANLSLAFHYSARPKKGEHERLQVLSEMNRVLKTNGRAIINLLYSDTLKDKEKFRKVAEAAGLRVVEEYTGDASSGSNYLSHCIVLEKTHDVDTDFAKLVERIGRNYEGVKLERSGVSSLKNSKKIIDGFTLGNQGMRISFNDQDRGLFEEEQSILKEGRTLKDKYAGIKEIPREELVNGGFLRIYNGKSYRLLKKSERIGGFVEIR